MRYQTTRGVPLTGGGARTLVEAYDYPLLFEPGESWDYGVGVDWASEMVMCVTNLSLEEYMKRNIWAPLGMEHITFFPRKNPDVITPLGYVAPGLQHHYVWRRCRSECQVDAY